MANTDVLLRVLSDVGNAVNDLKKVNKGMANLDKQAKKTESGVKKLSGGLKSFAGALGIGASIAVVVRGIVKFGKESVDVASRVQELGAKFDTVFGDKAAEARQQLEEFGDTVNRSSVDLQDMASEGQNVLVALGLQRDSAAEYSIGLTKLAVDVAAFQNAEDADVLNSFTSAIVGNHIAAKKFGVVINEAALNQQLFNMGVTGGMKAATEAEKAIARYNIILDRTADSHGAAAKEAGSYANITKGLDAAMLDLKATIGAALLPTMVELKKTQTKIIKGLTENIERTMLLDIIQRTNILTQKELLRATYSAGDADKYSNEQLTELVSNYEESQIAIINMSSGYDDYVSMAREVNGVLTEMTELEYAEIIASQESIAANVEQTANLLAQKEAMDDIRFGLNDITGKKEDYIEKTQELQQEAETLNGILDGQVSIYDSEYDSVGEVNEALDENTRKQAELSEQLTETTSKLIYQAVAQDLDSAAALALARGLGILDEQSYLLGTTIDDLTTRYVTGELSIGEYTKAVEDARNAVLSSDGISSDMYVNVHHTTTYRKDELGSGGGRTYSGRAIGGPVSDNSSYIVGELGPELFTPQSSGSITPNNRLGNNEDLLKEIRGLRSDLTSMNAGASATDIATAMRDQLQQVLG